MCLFSIVTRENLLVPPYIILYDMHLIKVAHINLDNHILHDIVDHEGERLLDDIATDILSIEVKT